MLEAESVHPQVTDGITQANVTALGNTSALSIAQTQLALAQSQSVLFANMVSTQQQQTTMNSAAVTQGIIQLFGCSKNDNAQAETHTAQALKNLVGVMDKNLSSVSQALATS